jgi:hypothetical protein
MSLVDHVHTMKKNELSVSKMTDQMPKQTFVVILYSLDIPFSEVFIILWHKMLNDLEE